ncbi:MAG: hypothetical protein WCT85_05545 [Parachlamydiales bacterium]|jgi:YD repeat-containing protein
MHRIFPLFFFIFISLFAVDDFEQSYNATVEGEPSAIVDGCVSAITGNLYLNSIDISSSGKEPIRFGRNYYNFFDWISKSESRPFKINENIIARQKKGGWEFFCHLYALINYGYLDERELEVYEPSGVKQIYRFCHHKKKDDGKNLPSRWNWNAFVNTSRGEISGRSNYKRNLVYRYDETNIKVIGVDGTIRNYIRSKPEDLKSAISNKSDQKFFKGKKIYEDQPYHLDTEILSNGYTLKYFYDEKHLNNYCEDYLGDPPQKIELISPSGKVFSHLNIGISSVKKNKDKYREISVVTNAEKKIIYQFEDMKSKEVLPIDLLKKIASDYGEEKIKYDLHHESIQIKEYKFPKGREFRFNYCNVKSNGYSQVVSEIYVATSPNVFETVHKFDYNKGTTLVKDSEGNQIVYNYDEDTLRLKNIERYDGDCFKNKEAFIWGSGGQMGFLLGKVIYDNRRIPIKAEKNIYDSNNVGNIETKIIYGTITGENKIPIKLDSTGLPINNGTDSYIKKFTYFPNYLVKSETDQDGLTTEYTYHASATYNEKKFLTDLPLTKLVKYKDQIRQRTFYIYDKDNILIKEINDDGSSSIQDDLTGVSRRLIKIIIPRQVEPLGLTDTLEEKYLDLGTNREVLLRKEKYEYYADGKISKKEIYGSDNKLKYTLQYKYDSKDNIIYETDPLGRSATYEYDENNNKTKEVDFSKKEIVYEYDNCNRLIGKIINNDENLKEGYKYNLKNNKIYEKDINGNITRYEYNVFNLLTKETFSCVEDTLGKKVTPVKIYTYDSLGRQISSTDASNNTTKINYNIFNKPISIEHPDSTKEIFTYNLNGSLKKYINQEGTETEYTYDYLKRVTAKKIYSNGKKLLEETFRYDAFNIVSKTDADGNLIKYTYDAAGRKVKEEFISKDQKLLSKEEFFYDELGFIKKRIDGEELVTNFKRDYLGRVLEETKQNSLNEVLYKIKYEYDEAGNKKKVISYIGNQESWELNFYDALNRLIKTVDGCSSETTINYDHFQDNQAQKLSRKTQENSLGQKIISTFDALDRQKTIEYKNPQDLTVSLEEKFYDLNGNLTRLISTIYNPDRSIKKVVSFWQYDSMNRLISLTEDYGGENEKRTIYTYTLNGNLKSTTKPDGTILYNEYDPLGNKIRFFSSKKDVDYEFFYNKLNQLEKVLDLNSNQTTQRKYDAKGNLLEEKLAYGPIIQSK